MQNDFAEIKVKDETELTKVIVRLRGIPKDNEMEQYLDYLNSVYQANKLFLIIYDASDIGMLSLSQIHKQADFMRSRDAETRRLIKKCAIVLTSAWARTALATLFTLKPPACDLKVVDSMEEARKFLKT